MTSWRSDVPWSIRLCFGAGRLDLSATPVKTRAALRRKHDDRVGAIRVRRGTVAR